MEEPLEKRIADLERQVSALAGKEPTAKPKDNWDKLSSLSTVLSGVFLAAIGIWVNHSLNVSQQSAQTAQADATRSIEVAHNAALDQQARDALALQKQQFEYSKQLQELQTRNQERQARDSLLLQQEHDAATQKLQAAQFEKDLMPQLQAGSQSQTVALHIMQQVNPTEAIRLSEYYSVTTSEPSLKEMASGIISNLAQSADPSVREIAKSAQVRVAFARRAQAITNVFEFGHASRSEKGAIHILNDGSDLTYGDISLKQGDLYVLIKRYQETSDSQLAKSFDQYLDQLKNRDAVLSDNQPFRQLLLSASRDPGLQQALDELFAQKYWDPAQDAAGKLGLKLPLSVASIYDVIELYGFGEFNRLKTRTSGQLGGTPSEGVDEKQWITAFVAYRTKLPRDQMLPGLKVRSEWFENAIKSNAWELEPPLLVNGVTINVM